MRRRGAITCKQPQWPVRGIALVSPTGVGPGQQLKLDWVCVEFLDRLGSIHVCMERHAYDSAR